MGGTAARRLSVSGQDDVVALRTLKRQHLFVVGDHDAPQRQRAHLQFTNLVLGNIFSRSQAHLRFSEQPAQMSCEQPQHSTCSLTGLYFSQAKQWNVACVSIRCSVAFIAVSNRVQKFFAVQRRHC